jgi:hypothetical protein
MDILAALQAAPSRGQRRCKLAVLLDDLKYQDGFEALADAIDDPALWTAVRLSLVFGNIGRPISTSTIQDHRGKRCICFQG